MNILCQPFKPTPRGILEKGRNVPVCLKLSLHFPVGPCPVLLAGLALAVSPSCGTTSLPEEASKRTLG